LRYRLSCHTITLIGPNNTVWIVIITDWNIIVFMITIWFIRRTQIKE
jgi:hypothetical protein